jgi:hypothetical protein
MQRICEASATMGPFLGKVRVIVFVVPMTFSLVMMKPSNPSRSPICVAWKEKLSPSDGDEQGNKEPGYKSNKYLN